MFRAEDPVLRHSPSSRPKEEQGVRKSFTPKIPGIRIPDHHSFNLDFLLIVVVIVNNPYISHGPGHD